MMTFSEPKLEIVECDNGYVVEWRKEGRPPRRDFDDDRHPTYGVKIFASKKEVAAFLATFFAK